MAGWRCCRGAAVAFAAEVWLRADGDAGTVAARKGRAPVLRCDDLGCVLRAANPNDQEQIQDKWTPVIRPDLRKNKGLEPRSDSVRNGSALESPVGAPLRIAMLKNPMALAEDCFAADIVIAPFDVPGWCTRHADVFDRKRLEQTGAVALYLGFEKRSFRGENGFGDPRAGDAPDNPGLERLGTAQRPRDTTPHSARARIVSPKRARIASMVSARFGRHRPWQGAAAD